MIPEVDQENKFTDNWISNLIMDIFVILFIIIGIFSPYCFLGAGFCYLVNIIEASTSKTHNFTRNIEPSNKIRDAI